MPVYRTAEELVAAMEDRLVAYDKAAQKAVVRGARLVEATAKRSIASGGTGRVYKKYNPKRTHQASAPNKPPATDTGYLIENISFVIDRRPKETVGRVISAAPYSKFLEFGTKDMLAAGGPRPFLQPALDSNREKIMKIFRDELGKSQ
jgi:HK97 gp10 family phage protein